MERKSGETQEQFLAKMRERLAKIESEILPNAPKKTITPEKEKVPKMLEIAAQTRKTFRKNVNANYEESENLRRKKDI